MWNASRFCVSSLRRGHANLLCIVPILVYAQPKLDIMDTKMKRFILSGKGILLYYTNVYQELK